MNNTIQDTYTIDYDTKTWLRYDNAPVNDDAWNRATALSILNQRRESSEEKDIQQMILVISYLRTSTQKKLGFKLVYVGKDSKFGPVVIVSLSEPECTIEELPNLIESINPGQASEITFPQTQLGKAFRKRQRFMTQEKKGLFRKTVEKPFEQIDYIWQPTNTTEQIGFEAVIVDFEALEQTVAAVDKLATGLRFKS